MIVTVTIRQIKAGSYPEFRKAWEPEQWWPGLTDVTLLRREESPEQILIVGRFDLDMQAFDEMRDSAEVHAVEDRRLQRMAPFEEALIENSVYEVLERVTPPAGGA
jgi:heme-degrading monooxygenase HmoA